MKAHCNLSLLLLLIASSFAFSQKGDQSLHPLRTATSPEGNYLYLLREEAFEDTALVASTKYFLIERTAIGLEGLISNETVNKYEKLEKVKPVDSEKELLRYYDPSELVAMQEYFGLSTTRQLVDYFQNHHSAEDFGQYYPFIETRQALGHVFLDKDVEPGQYYFYRATRVTNEGEKILWSTGLVKSRIGNYTLPYIKPYTSGYEVFDSSVTVQWKVHIKDLLSYPRPESDLPKDTAGAIYLIPFPASALTGLVKQCLPDGSWKTTEEILPLRNEADDTLTFNYYQKINPENSLVFALTLKDEVNNIGLTSDTLLTYSIDKKTVAGVRGIEVEAVPNGISLGWETLPMEPYFSGIQVLRYNSDEVVDTVAILGPKESSYIDYAIEVGQIYTYHVSALYLPSTLFQQEIAAQGVGTFKVFTRPLPPYDMAASQEGENIRLSWKSLDKAGLYGFYLYRGTSPMRMYLLSGPIKDTSYLDASEELSGESQYFYKVLSQNLRQDTSDYSNIASIAPSRALNIESPARITFYYANGALDVNWNDVRKKDNRIESFIVEKKTANGDNFTLVTPAPVTENYWTDNSVLPGRRQQYRVASLSFKGDTSQFSDAYEYKLPQPNVPTVQKFTVRNISSGVEIALPRQEMNNRQAYNIYRRKVAEQSFSKIHSMPASEFIFVDNGPAKGETYVYAISIVADDGREGDLGKSISVKR